MRSRGYTFPLDSRAFACSLDTYISVSKIIVILLTHLTIKVLRRKVNVYPEHIWHADHGEAGFPTSEFLRAKRLFSFVHKPH